MIKTTLKELKEMTRHYGALDLTNAKDHEIEEIRQTVGLNKIAYSAGVYGCNGYLLEDNNGKKYTIIGRVSNMYLV